MFNQRGLWIGFVASVLGCSFEVFSSGLAQAELIDNFENATPANLGGLFDPGINLIGAPDSANTSDTVAGVIGGTRTGQFNLTGIAPNGQLTAFVTGGVLSMNLGANSTGTHMLTYNPGGVDFSADLGLELFVDLDLAAAAGTTFEVTLTDGDTSHTASILVNSAAPQIISFLFPTFTNPGTLDLTNIQTIVLLITPAEEGDVVIDNFQQIPNVPEPTSLAIWSSILATGWLVRRRFQRAKT